MMRNVVALGVLLLASANAKAHESPVDHVERTVRLTIADGRLDIRYRVELSERNAMLQLRAMDADADGKISGAECRNFFAAQANLLAGKLKLEVDGQPLELACTGEVELDARLGQTFHLTAPLQLKAAESKPARLTDYHARYAPGPYRLLQPPLAGRTTTRLELTDRPQLVDLERHPGLVVVEFKVIAGERPPAAEQKNAAAEQGSK